MIIGVRGEFNFEQCANAAQAAMLIATEGGALCVLVDKGFGWGSQQYADAPSEWVAAVATISATAEFKAAVAEKRAAEKADGARREAFAAAQDRANARYSRLHAEAKSAVSSSDIAAIAACKAAYEEYAATTDGKTVAHGYLAELFAPAPAVFVAVESDLLAAIAAGNNTAASIAAYVGAAGADNIHIVTRKLAGMVFRKTLRQDRRGCYSAVA